MAEQRTAASPGEPGIIVLSYGKIRDSLPQRVASISLPCSCFEGGS